MLEFTKNTLNGISSRINLEVVHLTVLLAQHVSIHGGWKQALGIILQGFDL